MAEKKDKTSKALMVPASEEALALLRQEFPADNGFNRILLPRLRLVSQNVWEGKGAKAKVTVAAGTFFMDVETDEVDENEKKIWEHTELGTEIEGIILFQRKQLRYYDEGTQEFTSSPVYDTDDEVMPLWCNKKEVAKGTAKELRALPQYQIVKNNKKQSALEENRILYVLFETGDGERKIYQLNLRGSSMFSYLDFKKKVVPSTVLTHFSSSEQQKGSNEWNRMEFKIVRPINGAEFEEVIGHVKELKNGIAMQKDYYEAEAKTDSAVEA